MSCWATLSGFCSFVRRQLTVLALQARENDPAALRAKARAAQLRSDMDSAASLFGEASLNGASHFTQMIKKICS